MEDGGFYRRVRDFYFVLALIGCGIIYCRGLSAIYELHPHDESFYFYMAKTGTRVASWAPLYSVFLSGYNWLSLQITEIYFLNYAVLGIAIAVLAFKMLRYLGLGRNAAFCLSVFVLIADANIPLAPKVNHFNILLLGLLWQIGLQFSRNLHGAVFIWAGIVPTCWIRQDNIFCWLVFGGWIAGRLFSRGQRWQGLKPFAAGLVASVLLGAGLTQLWGNPFGHNRGWHAFRDHFYWRNGLAEGLSQTLAIESVFGDADSILKAMVNNPAEIVRHMRENFEVLLRDLPEVFFSHTTLFFRGHVFELPWELADTAVLVLVLLLFSLPIFAKNEVVKPEKQRVAFVFLSLFFVSSLLKGAVAALLFSAWVRYYLEFWFFGFILIVFWIFRRLPPRSSLLLPIFLLSVFPSHKSSPPRGLYNDMGVNRRNPDHYYRGIVDTVRAMQIKSPATCYSFNFLWVHFGENFDCSIEAPRGKTEVDFRQFLSDSKLHILLVDEMALRITKEQPTTFLTFFAQHFSEFGFVRRPNSEMGLELFTRP